MLLVPVEVKPSKIHGKGVFATRDIARGTIIWKLMLTHDHIIPAHQAYDEMEKDKSGALRDIYENWGSKKNGFFVVCVDNAQFMNHSHRPNTFCTMFEQRAIEVIKAGEEITCDYNEFDEQALGFKVS